MKRKCQNCEYYDPVDKFEGLCKRYPPSIVPSDNLPCFYPVLDYDEWCGEFKQKDSLDSNKSLKVLGLSTRTKKCLSMAKIETIDDLINCSSEYLLSLRTFGRHCLWEVNTGLSGLGLKLKED